MPARNRRPADSMFEEIRKKIGREGYDIRSKKAAEWFVKTMRQVMGGLTQKKVINDSGVKKVSQIKVGRLYAFGYDPKHKDTLPYYDRFPMVLVIGPAKGGFLGLNFHYLHPRDRAFLFDQIAKIHKKKTINKNTRFQITYETLKAASAMKRFQPCLKHYLENHVVTALGEIPSDDARIAIHLPTSRFVYASGRKVWSDSRKKY